MKEILIWALIFLLGICVGFLLRWWLVRRTEDYSGTIFVHRDTVSEKVVYSLELNDFPEKLEFKKIVVFKVDTSD